MTKPNEVIVMGDFNFHMNKPDKPNPAHMNEILDAMDLIQHVTEPTHKDGNTLDLIITRNDTKLISHTVDFMISDHMSILMSLDIEKPKRPRKHISFRRM